MTRLAPCLMVQGTGSGVGKSLLAAALCRLFARAGYRVAPFKAQNMALNAAVADGGEIGRAQAAQAEAAGVEPSVDMNPILLKPESDHRSQVVVRGRPVASADWRAYRAMQPALLPIVSESLERLRRTFELVLIEGAGSPAEINLRAHDFTNMRVARLAGAPVLLVSDIDRGGVFAALVGTLALLDPADRARVGGLIVNKLRGDRSILAPGLDELVARTGVPVLGVVPWLAERLVPAEDSLDLDAIAGETSDAPVDAIEIAVVRLPRIANFDDFEPLAAEPGVRVRFVATAPALRAADLVVLPGSKSTMADLAWLHATGLAAAVVAAVAAGRPVLGVCGGFQMLGETLCDPERVESEQVAAAGLGLLPVTTTFAREKTTSRVKAHATASGPFVGAVGRELAAYEIHAGHSTLTSPAPRPFTIVERGGASTSEPDGAMSASGNIVGTYLHGLFANGALRRSLLDFLAERRGRPADPRWGSPGADGYERLADIVGRALDMPAIAKLAGLPFPGA
jgi:adenosylcobyric acid synthase